MTRVFSSSRLGSTPARSRSRPKEPFEALKNHGLFEGVTTNQGRSLAEKRRKLLGRQLFRTLAPDYALALLSVDGIAFDHVIRVPQLTNDDLA